ncbi:efflux RND transporter periplasmic adaptor subunit [Anaeromyxobacter sp. Fw109-5]|uniref:efflux RND transporter periplasmic adaptor subunit n=1 Tax=Anaeromyxobacter sp. (strain Fw109-5) TaxID=404589 RepID=UPI000158A87D|nr:efflux RND transporter periplasmic adaptor subunit [Anaeromyxobacter sp. Fw109-5]ABS28273.1 efflux transporter, RND family, MFP subunit [Anaeromyxobacter sp. Fw109-5]
MTRTLLALALLGALASCRERPGGGDDHDHAPRAAGHGDHAPAERPGRSITHFGERTELFVEFPVLVRGEESRFAAHLNDLERFRPLEKGRVEVVLSGGGAPDERFAATDPSPAGIFRPVVKPAHAAKRRLALTVEGAGVTDRHDLGEVQVFVTVAEAAGAGEEEEAPGLVPYLKEQQWRTEFATAPAAEAELRPSVLANGTLRARPDGESRIAAPVAGRLVAAGGGFPFVGRQVRAGEVLAALAPRVGGDADPASLELAVTQARLDLELARKDLARLEELASAEAVPERRVQDARRAVAEGEARLAAGQARKARFEGSAGGGAGRIMLRSTIAGTVALIGASPGTLVEEGREVIHVVDLDRLWLEVQIPEADVGRIGKPTGAWFEVEGFAAPFEVAPERGGRVIGFGGVIDPQTRTAPLVLELPNAGRDLRVGMFARVHVLTGPPVKAVAVPASAVVDDGSEQVVFVEVSGERFERRPVRLGLRDGERVQVLAGVQPGERVVSRGAYQVRLAASSGAIPQHGHVH